MKIIYRICDKKPTTQTGISKIDCLQNFHENIGLLNSIIVADNCSPQMIEKLKNFQPLSIVETSLGNSGSFNKCLEIALDFDGDEFVYFIEDDYWHLPNSLIILNEGLAISDFVSLYDHPDKYINNSVNPLIDNGGEYTRVLLSNSCHWKETNSTTMTFACKVETLWKVADIMRKYLHSDIPKDFMMWREILQEYRLITPMPSYSTHCHNPWIAPLFEFK